MMVPFEVKDTITIGERSVVFYRLGKLDELGLGEVLRLPYSIKILLEAILRKMDGHLITKENVEMLARWSSKSTPDYEIPFMPARVILQDFTGVPAVVDLAALRTVMQRLGGNPADINPLIPVDLIIDHSIQVDYYGNANARSMNEKKEFERNRERYTLLRWAQQAFNNFRVVPPGKGIIHQINLEYLAPVIQLQNTNGELVAYPDTLVGTDSHTTTVNGLGVLGWGVGGIEAEAVMLGQPYYMPIPEVVGCKLTGKLNEEATATDLVLTITQKLREHGVVGKFVEFFGPGVKTLSIPDRSTISNMAPEYGATVGFFPIDEETLKYLKLSGRDHLIELIKSYAIAQGIFSAPGIPEPHFTQTLVFNLSTVEPSLAGPTRPQDRISLGMMKKKFHQDMENMFKRKITEKKDIDTVSNGSVILAAITSCTNTSNPSVLFGAGLLAKNAVERGLKVKPHVKTSLAPGSRVVTEYLKAAGLLRYLEELGFHLVGYGCTTCIGNSGPLPLAVTSAIQEKELIVAGVISGNRNFEGRIHPLIKANYLASPLLVIAYAIAGTIDIDLINEPVGYTPDNVPVYLKDIWPTKNAIQQGIKNYLRSEMFTEQYTKIFEGSDLWNGLKIPEGYLFEWDYESTYIREPPFFQDFTLHHSELSDIKNARVLALLGDSITTDHISPAGKISPDEPAGKFLISRGVEVKNFNSFGSRRGNHEVMMRGTFGNIRLRNKLIPNKEGGWTLYIPTGEIMPIFDAAKKYYDNDIPLIIIAGKEYGTGSSRDWAAKGIFLLGIKAVIAESFERIHRSNLVGMGVLPLQFKKDENVTQLDLKGDEIFDILGIKNIKPGGDLLINVRNKNASEKKFRVTIRLDTPIELDYYRNGGILHTVLRKMLNKE